KDASENKGRKLVNSGANESKDSKAAQVAHKNVKGRPTPKKEDAKTTKPDPKPGSSKPNCDSNRSPKGSDGGKTQSNSQRKEPNKAKSCDNERGKTASSNANKNAGTKRQAA